jgi:hypothetical protein
MLHRACRIFYRTQSHQQKSYPLSLSTEVWPYKARTSFPSSSQHFHRCQSPKSDMISCMLPTWTMQQLVLVSYLLDNLHIASWPITPFSSPVPRCVSDAHMYGCNAVRSVVRFGTPSPAVHRDGMHFVTLCRNNPLRLDAGMATLGTLPHHSHGGSNGWPIEGQ